MPYRIVYTQDALAHLDGLPRRLQAIVEVGVRRRLRDEPDIETRNRKPLRKNPVAPWELRLGTVRVYYEVQQLPEPVVHIHAIGIKERNRVRIGGRLVDL